MSGVGVGGSDFIGQMCPFQQTPKRLRAYCESTQKRRPGMVWGSVIGGWEYVVFLFELGRDLTSGLVFFRGSFDYHIDLPSF